MNAPQFLLRSLITLVLVATSMIVKADPADYFARFKYTKAEAIQLLRTADGHDLHTQPAARALLDDMGYWKTVREPAPFKLTADLEARLAAQYDYLAKAFSYEPGDTVWVKAESQEEMPYGIARINHRAQIVGHERVGGTDYYSVDIYTDGSASMMNRTGKLYDGRQAQILYYGPNYKLTRERRVYTKSELDVMNSPGSSLPVDNVGEKLDWAGDKVWQDKLEAFKEKMVAQKFEIDFTQAPAKVAKQQAQLMLELFRYFKMNRNARSNNGQGIGMRSCGGGVCYDQALVLTFAVQALGQSQGLKAMNLDGTTVNPMGGHGFVRVDIKGNPQTVTFDPVYDYDQFVANKSREGAKLIYPGLKLRTDVFTGISDPGWADYGVTADQFALMPITEALNTIPIDANRAVHGLSHERPLVEVAQQISAKGPLATQIPQAVASLTHQQRVDLTREIETKGQMASAVKAVLGSTGATLICSDLFGGAL